MPFPRIRNSYAPPQSTTHCHPVAPINRHLRKHQPQPPPSASQIDTRSRSPLIEQSVRRMCAKSNPHARSQEDFPDPARVMATGRRSIIAETARVPGAYPRGSIVNFQRFAPGRVFAARPDRGRLTFPSRRFDGMRSRSRLARIIDRGGAFSNPKRPGS